MNELEKINYKKRNDEMKYEIAKELGLIDKINEFGFKNLTAKESGQIGGIIAKRNRELKNIDKK